jgi:L-methionine (R)-S-oxide reductase
MMDDLLEELRGLLAGETDPIANAANTAALIFTRVPGLNWAGFYFLRDGILIVGPFQGLPACTRIPLGRGVCGTAAVRGETIVVADVHAFDGHIACDAASRSEIVVPFGIGGALCGVLDIDSPVLDRFSAADRAFFEAVVQAYTQACGPDATLPAAAPFMPLE